MNREELKAKLANLPYEPGCYLMKDNKGVIIYVGKAIKLHNRVNQYFVGAHDFKTTKMISHIDDFDFVVTASEKEALVLEINLIKKYRPKYNIMFIDDSTYPYIKLTKEKYPRLMVARDTRKDRHARYFGPFPDAFAARETRKLLMQLYPFRRCTNLPTKVCLYYHMGQCLGPCEFEVDPKVYEEYGEQVTSFLNGNTSEVKKQLKTKMQEASDSLAFEQASEYKSMLDSIEAVVDKQSIEVELKGSRDVFAYYADKGYIAFQGFFVRRGTILEKEFRLQPLYGDSQEEFVSFLLQFYENHPKAAELVLPNDLDVTSLEELLDTRIFQPERGYRKKLIGMCQENAKKQLDLKFAVVENQDKKTEEAVQELADLTKTSMHRVELYDNSHTAGTFTVGACVVYEDGEPSRKDYRTYKLHTGNSDVDSMKEVLYRRYYRMVKENGNFPDAIFVDGGYTQILAAKEVLDSLEVTVPIFGMVKDNHHNTDALMNQEGERLEIAKQSSLFFLITRMQDEIHRVAIGYHRKLRAKAQTRSILDEVEGIGPKRKRMLLKTFGNFTGLKNASVEALENVLPKDTAAAVYEVLHAEE